MTPENLKFREVDRDRWEDLERLFEARGGPKYCWCMVWRRMPKGAGRADSGAKKDALRQIVERDTPVGILGYLDEKPMAWCSVAPQRSYRELGGSRYPLDASENVWSIACFFTARRLRGQGITRRLIGAAVDYAARNGATVVEAYAVEPDSPSYTISA